MSVIGRGSIAQVQYSGDEAVAEIKKLLDAVVSYLKSNGNCTA
jgi:pre-mRNA-processing factor 39